MGGRSRGSAARVSIRAPRTGGDPAICTDVPTTAAFQSAPPHGGRLFVMRETITFKGGFNPRPRTGGDAALWTAASSEIGFNPRPRTGGDPSARTLTRPTRRFNPRPRTGGDSVSWPTCTGPSCFNPRPRTGGDPAQSSPRTPPEVSIRAPARGATYHLGLWALTIRFQSAPPHGGRLAPNRR